MLDPFRRILPLLSEFINPLLGGLVVHANSNGVGVKTIGRPFDSWPFRLYVGYHNDFSQVVHMQSCTCLRRQAVKFGNSHIHGSGALRLGR